MFFFVEKSKSHTKKNHLDGFSQRGSQLVKKKIYIYISIDSTKILIFFLQKHIDLLQRAFIKPPELCGALSCYGFIHFYWTIGIVNPIHCHWKSQGIFLYNSDRICLKEESHILLGWPEGE